MTDPSQIERRAYRWSAVGYFAMAFLGLGAAWLGHVAAFAIWK